MLLQSSKWRRSIRSNRCGIGCTPARLTSSISTFTDPRMPSLTIPPEFRVRVTKDHLVFSAAHFITFNGNICERLHGHNWRAAVEVRGPLDENQYVFDFIALRDTLQKIVLELDHHMLLPTQHPQIKVSESDREVEVRFEERRWVF